MAGLACRNTTASGREILPQDTMRAVLWEMFEVDAYNDTRAATDSNFRHDSAFASLYTDIFKVHHLTREQFQDSYDYYLAHPEILRSMIDTLADRTNRDMQKAGGAPVNRPGGLHRYTPPAGRPPVPLGPNGRPLQGFPRRPGAFPPGQQGAAPPAYPNGTPLKPIVPPGQKPVPAGQKGTPPAKTPPAQKGTPPQKNPVIPVQ